MIVPFLFTASVEGLVAIGYSVWQKKPVRPILLTGICGNLITQSLLWVVLNLFFSYYLVALYAAELLIWLIEGVFLYAVPANRLNFKDAILLSLSMNLVSFALGWFLPA